jgi:hypothetical protein
MTDRDINDGVPRDAAEQAVQFLHATEGDYVLTLNGRIGAKPYYRAAEYGGFKVKSIVGDGSTVKKGHCEDEEFIDLLTDCRSFDIVHKHDTPTNIWGTYDGGGNKHVTSELLEAEKIICSAARATRHEAIDSLLTNLADSLSAVTQWYIAEGADGDAEVSDGD